MEWSFGLCSNTLHVSVLPLFPQACSDKLQREMQEYSFPPNFPATKEEDEEDGESGQQNREQVLKDPANRSKKVHAPIHIGALMIMMDICSH